MMNLTTLSFWGCGNTTERKGLELSFREKKSSLKEDGKMAKSMELAKILNLIRNNFGMKVPKLKKTSSINQL